MFTLEHNSGIYIREYYLSQTARNDFTIAVFVLSVFDCVLLIHVNFFLLETYTFFVAKKTGIVTTRMYNLDSFNGREAYI